MICFSLMTKWQFEILKEYIFQANHYNTHRITDYILSSLVYSIRENRGRISHLLSLQFFLTQSANSHCDEVMNVQIFTNFMVPVFLMTIKFWKTQNQPLRNMRLGKMKDLKCIPNIDSITTFSSAIFLISVCRSQARCISIVVDLDTSNIF